VSCDRKIMGSKQQIKVCSKEYEVLQKKFYIEFLYSLLFEVIPIFSFKIVVFCYILLFCCESALVEEHTNV